MAEEFFGEGQRAAGSGGGGGDVEDGGVGVEEVGEGHGWWPGEKGRDVVMIAKQGRGDVRSLRLDIAVVLRNAALVLGNGGDAAALPSLRRAASDLEPMVADAAAWAVRRLEAVTCP